MKILGKTLAGLALAGLAMAQPAAAAAAAPERAGSPAAQSEALTGVGLWIVVGFVVALGLAEITGAIDIFGDDPASP